MKKWLNFFPFLGIPIVRILDMDMVVIPTIRYYFSFWVTLALASVIATLELIYIYYIVGRIEKLVQEAAKRAAKKIAQKINKDDPEFAQDIVRESKGIFSRAKKQAEKIYNYALDKYSHLVELAKTTIFPILQRGGYFAIFFVGLIPETGFRVGGAIFCQFINSRKALAVLLVGNIFKTAGMVKFWEFLQNFPLWLRFVIIISSLVLLWFLTKLFIKKKPPM